MRLLEISKATLEELDFSRVVTFEVWAGRHSQITRVSARLGATAIRVVKPFSARYCKAQVPCLQKPRIPQTWALNMEDAQCASQLESLVGETVRRTHEVGSCRVDAVLIVTSPPCKPWCRWHNINRKRKRNPMPLAKLVALRKTGLKNLATARRLHDLASSCAKPGTLLQIHEQPGSSLAPKEEHGPAAFAAAHLEWPWAISAESMRFPVCCCSTGLRCKKTKKHFGKKWLFEMQPCGALAKALHVLQCSKDHDHQVAQGARTCLTEEYTPFLGNILSMGSLYDLTSGSHRR